MVDVLLLCAIPVEWTSLKTLISSPVADSVFSDPCLLGELELEGGHLTCALVEAGVGTTVASLATHGAIDKFSPRLVIFAGVAGGVKDVAVGDVVLASKVYYYEGGKSIDGFFHPRPEAFLAPQGLLNIARTRVYAEREGFRVFVGPIASGEKVVADAESAQANLIRHAYGDSLAVEMEGAGFMQACHRKGTTDYLLVRGISDLMAGKETSDRSGGQETASANVTSVVTEVIRAFFQLEEAISETKGGGPSVAKGPARQLFAVPRPTQNETYVLIAPHGSAMAEEVVNSGLPLTLVLDLDPVTDRTGLLSKTRASSVLARPVHLLRVDDQCHVACFDHAA